MKVRTSTPYWRLVFGISVAGFGAVLLWWRDADAWQNLPVAHWPFAVVVDSLLALAQVVAGFGMLSARTVRWSSMLAAVIYGLFALMSIPGIVAQPKVFGAYFGFFQWFALLCGGIVLFRPALARIGIGLCTIVFALGQIFYFKFTESLVPAWIPPNPAFWVYLTTAAFFLAALAILIHRQARLAMRLTGLMIALFGILVWVPQLAARQSSGNWSEFVLNFLIAGAIWTVGEEGS